MSMMNRRGGGPPRIRPPQNRIAWIIVLAIAIGLAVVYWHSFFQAVFTGKP